MTTTVSRRDRPSDAAERIRTTTEDRVLLPVTVTFLLLIAAVGAVELSGRTIPAGVQVVPFAVSILVFGLPHGALDHLVPARLDRRLSTLRSVAIVVVVYVVVGGATALLWISSPLTGFVAFIVLTWFHWGQGDLYIARLLGDGDDSRAGRALTVAFRGALPMLVPLIAHPREYASVITRTVGLLTPGTATAPLDVSPAVRLLAAGVIVGLGASILARRRRSGRPRARRLLEVATLVVFFAVLPPLLAVGIYFTLWHSVRHIVRLELTDAAAAESLAQGLLLRPLLRFLSQAWPITAIAVALLLGLALCLHSATLGVYLILIAALTTPHAAVVTWMDLRQCPPHEQSHLLSRLI